MEYFDIPKASDIQLVCNVTGCGSNIRVWVPNLWLLVLRSAINILNSNYCCIDIDLGDFFINFHFPAIYWQ
jgi:hypothetical protein